jgi:ketosteroid isomerase-like protein
MVYLDEQVVRQLYDAFNRRDYGIVLKLYSEGVVLHCPGRNQVSGDYRGRQEVLEFWKRQGEVSSGTFQPQVIFVAEGDEHIIVVTDIEVERAGKTFAWRRILHFLMMDSRVAECWIYEGNQYAADEAFA